MTLSNNTIFAYQIKNFPKKYDAKYFRATFPGSKLKRNIHDFSNREYRGVLEFKGTGGEGALLFIFSKIKTTAQGFYDFSPTAKIMRFFIGDNKSQLPYDVSYFAYFPNHNIILGLYNHDAFGHVTASLQEYIREFIGEKDVELNLIEPPVNPQEVLKNIDYVNNVTIKFAIRDIQNSSEKENLDPFSALKDYSKKGTKQLHFPYLKKYGTSVIKTILGLKDEYPEAKNIIVDGQNLHQDILGTQMMRFPMSIKVDSKGQAVFDDFAQKVVDIFKQYKDSSLNGY